MDLYEAFDLAPGAIVAAVGGGGKTSLIYSLAQDAANRGLSAIVTTTTKFTRPRGVSMPAIVETSDLDASQSIGAVLRPGAVVVATTGAGERQRLLGFEPGSIARLALLGAGLIAVEADGSAHRPFKAPGAHEPVIPACATDVVVCVGLEVLGHELCDTWVHRSELAGALAQFPPGAPVTPELIVRVLLHPEGGRKGVPAGARLHALLNNPASPEHEQLAVHLGQRLVYGGFRRVVVASAHRRCDIRAVLC